MERMNQFTRNRWDGFRRVGSRLRRSRSRRGSEDSGPEYQVMLPVGEPEEDEHGRKKIRFRPAIIRKVPGMIRRSLRKKKPDNEVVNDSDTDMDLREITPDAEKVEKLEEGKPSTSSAPGSLKSSGSRKSVPSKGVWD